MNLLTWNPEVGLWRKDAAGHTAPVKYAKSTHSGVNATRRLLKLAQINRLNNDTLLPVLRALRVMQTRSQDPIMRGCFCWYWEEEKPMDTNAAFFIGMDILMLHIHFSHLFEDESRGLLAAMMADLRAWFDLHVQNNNASHYPNKYLGDLVCAWLLHENCIGSSLPDSRLLDLSERTTRIARIWLVDERWGWGEHMSDIYARVMLNQLSALLLSHKSLPEPAKNLFHQLATDLLEIDDRFAGGPRIPILRSYSFVGCPQRSSFRARIRGVKAEEYDAFLEDSEEEDKDKTLPDAYGALWDREGWHCLFPISHSDHGTSEYLVACHDNAVAQSWLQDGLRVGAMSRFPIMENRGIEHSGGGMSWQCFPACLWHPDGLWAFWRWESNEGQRHRAHPSFSFHDSFLDNALATSQTPVPLGRTASRQHGANFLLARQMPVVGQKWDRCADTLWMLGLKKAPTVEQISLEWYVMELAGAGEFGAEAIHVHYLRLDGSPEPTLTQGPDGSWQWGVEWNKEVLKQKPPHSLWAIQVGAGQPEKPVWETLPGGGHLTWAWPGCNWNVDVDWTQQRDFLKR